MKKRAIFLDVDGTLIYEDKMLKKHFNDTLIAALKAANIIEVNLLTSMNMRDVPEREELVAHLEAHGIMVVDVITKLDLRVQPIELGSVWKKAKGNVTYKDGKVTYAVKGLEELAQPFDLRASLIKENGRNYKKTEKNLLMSEFLKNEENVGGIYLFIDDVGTEIAAVRDAFNPTAEDVDRNNDIYADKDAENEELSTLQMTTERGTIITHFNKKNPELNTFQDYAKALLMFKIECLHQGMKTQILKDFEEAGSSKKPEDSITKLFTNIDAIIANPDKVAVKEEKKGGFLNKLFSRSSASTSKHK